MAKLKVFRTAAGFHDAYVAAPSRKAALAAWGADKDLFARGAAEEVTDPALMAAPLATPGAVVKVSRGSRAEQLAALPEDKPKRAPAPAPGRAAVPPPPPTPAPQPPPQAPAAADQARAAPEARHDRERAALAEEEAALEHRKREAKRTQGAEVARLERARETVDAEYRTALAAWRRSAPG